MSTVSTLIINTRCQLVVGPDQIKADRPVKFQLEGNALTVAPAKVLYRAVVRGAMCGLVLGAGSQVETDSDGNFVVTSPTPVPDPPGGVVFKQVLDPKAATTFTTQSRRCCYRHVTVSGGSGSNAFPSGQEPDGDSPLEHKHNVTKVTWQNRNMLAPDGDKLTVTAKVRDETVVLDWGTDLDNDVSVDIDLQGTGDIVVLKQRVDKLRVLGFAIDARAICCQTVQVAKCSLGNGATVEVTEAHDADLDVVNGGRFQATFVHGHIKGKNEGGTVALGLCDGGRCTVVGTTYKDGSPNGAPAHFDVHYV